MNRVTLWVPLRKSVVYLSRHLNALAQVDDRTPGLRALDAITSRKQLPSAQPVKAFNPLSRPDRQLFAALMSGEHTLHGFANRDLREKLAVSVLRPHNDPKKASSQVSRLLHRLHVHGLVAKIPPLMALAGHRLRPQRNGNSGQAQAEGFPEPLSGRRLTLHQLLRKMR